MTKTTMQPLFPAQAEDAVDLTSLPDNPYLLLTPGPLSTSKSVKAAMLRDWCTWDDDYHSIVQELRGKLAKLATKADGYTAALMQGSGTFCVEATIGTVLPGDGTLLVLANGAYGERLVEIARRLRIRVLCNNSGEVLPRISTCWRRPWRPTRASPTSPWCTARPPRGC